MAFDTTILKKHIQKLKDAFENGDFGEALIGAVNTGNGLMQQRVFVENKDIKGNGFGGYVGAKRKLSEKSKTKKLSLASRTDKKRIKASAGLQLTAYQRKRAEKGRQVAKKDLEFHGGLRRAIDTKLESEKIAAIEFSNDESAKIARGQENQITNIRSGKPGSSKGDGVKIFNLNNSEREQVVEQGSELIKQILKR